MHIPTDTCIPLYLIDKDMKKYISVTQYCLQLHIHIRHHFHILITISVCTEKVIFPIISFVGKNINISIN